MFDFGTNLKMLGFGVFEQKIDATPRPPKVWRNAVESNNGFQKFLKKVSKLFRFGFLLTARRF
jgi:hypothetical protein